MLTTFVNAIRERRGKKKKMLGKINPEEKKRNCAANSQSLQKYFALAQPNV